jgi:hypothetical protein
MEKDSKDPKIIILSEYDKIDAEEYVEDTDHVYRKKDEVYSRFKFNTSLFWMRLACFFGLMAMIIVVILRVIKMMLAIIISALQYFKDKLLNKQIRNSWEEFKNAGKVFVSLAVGVVNPKWGMRLMSLFFSMTDQENHHPFLHKFFRFSRP